MPGEIDIVMGGGGGGGGEDKSPRDMAIPLASIAESLRELVRVERAMPAGGMGVGAERAGIVGPGLPAMIGGIAAGAGAAGGGGAGRPVAAAGAGGGAGGGAGMGRGGLAGASGGFIQELIGRVAKTIFGGVMQAANETMDSIGIQVMMDTARAMGADPRGAIMGGVRRQMGGGPLFGKGGGQFPGAPRGGVQRVDMPGLMGKAGEAYLKIDAKDPGALGKMLTKWGTEAISGGVGAAVSGGISGALRAKMEEGKVPADLVAFAMKQHIGWQTSMLMRLNSGDISPAGMAEILRQYQADDAISTRDPRSWLLMGRRRHRGIMKIAPMGQGPSAQPGGGAAGSVDVGIGGDGMSVGVGGGGGASTGRVPLMGATPKPGDPEFERSSPETQRLLMEQKRDDTSRLLERMEVHRKIQELDVERQQIEGNTVQRSGMGGKQSRVYFMLSDRWNA